MKKFFNEIKNIDKSIIKVMKRGFRFSFVLCVFFTYILSLYSLNPVSHIIFDIGFLGVRCSFTFFASFFVGGIASSKILKKI